MSSPSKTRFTLRVGYDSNGDVRLFSFRTITFPPRILCGARTTTDGFCRNFLDQVGSCRSHGFRPSTLAVEDSRALCRYPSCQLPASWCGNAAHSASPLASSAPSVYNLRSQARAQQSSVVEAATAAPLVVSACPVSIVHDVPKPSAGRIRSKKRSAPQSWSSGRPSILREGGRKEKPRPSPELAKLEDQLFGSSDEEVESK